VKLLGENIQADQNSIAQLPASVETNLAFATRAETWERKEMKSQ
jgi:hypothetical protein